MSLSKKLDNDRENTLLNALYIAAGSLQAATKIAKQQRDSLATAEGKVVQAEHRLDEARQNYVTYLQSTGDPSTGATNHHSKPPCPCWDCKEYREKGGR